MSDKPQAQRYSDNKETVTIHNKRDLTLGDLRQAVEAAAGISDKATVTFEQVGRSYVRVDEYTADRVWIRGERDTDQPSWVAEEQDCEICAEHTLAGKERVLAAREDQP